jgi:hypothetical protein
MPQTTYERNEIHWQKQRDKRNEEPRVWDERLWDPEMECPVILGQE